MISVIITTYNYGRYVERALRSVLTQTESKGRVEVIVVDDASTDHTVEVLTNYAQDARIYHLEENVGLAAARNFGIRKAKGQFIVFLDADDYLQQDALYVQRVFLEGNNAIDAVATDYYTVNEQGTHLEHVSCESHPIACGIMFRKDYLHDIGLYDESFRAREEEDLRIRFLNKYSIYHLPVPMYRYRKHGSNLTSNEAEMKHYQEKLDAKHNADDSAK